jgi:hypothetical protein
MDGSPSPARDEAARRAVILAFGVLSVVLMIWAERACSDPDVFRRARMRHARASERAWATIAARAWHAAERARLDYEEQRP